MVDSLSIYPAPSASDASEAADSAAGVPTETTATPPPAGAGMRLWAWFSLLVCLPIAWWLLQVLALLVQTERLRNALETGLQVAHLPRATTMQVMQRTEQAVDALDIAGSRNSSSPFGSLSFPQFLSLSYFCNSQLAPASPKLLEEGDLLEVMLATRTDTVLPRWLGPRLPGAGTDVLRVRWQVTVGRPN